MTTRSANLYAAECFECGQMVPAGAGTREFWHGAWRVRHKACDERASVIDAAIEGAEAKAALHRSSLRHPSNIARPVPTSAPSSRPPAPAGVCPRHGAQLEPSRFPRFGGCWECNMEADEAERDLEETRNVAEYKLRRDGFE